MKKLMKKFVLVASALVLSACVDSRQPVFTALKQSGDLGMSCEQIAMEFKINTEVATQKIALNNEDDAQDLVVGALIWPGLADFTNADGLEGNSILDRNLWLREIAKEKSCDTLAYPQQPVRYD